MRDIAVVIVNYRTPSLVEQCLASLPGDVEVVVVDNASGDGSAARLSAGARVVERPRNDGFAAGVNTGFASTAAPFVVVLNPDAIAAPRALETLAEHLRTHPRTALAGPRLLDADGVPQASAYRHFPTLRTQVGELLVPYGYLRLLVPAVDRYHAAGPPVAHVYGACMAIRRDAYDDVGPLDESFFLYLEETEWQERAAAHGWDIAMVPEATVTHLVRGGGDEALAPSRHWFESAVRHQVLRGHRPGVARGTLRAASVASWLFMEAVALVRRDELRRRRAAAWRAFATG